MAMGAWASEFRLAFRNLARRPGFTATALLTLALGIGVNTLVFTWAKALVLRPLPGVAHAQSVVFLSGIDGERNGLSHPTDALELYRQAEPQSFVDLAGFEFVEMAIGSGSRPELIGGGVVTGNYFDLLGVRGRAGRLLGPADDGAGSTPAAVLTARLATRLFGSPERAVGQTVRLHASDVAIVGVVSPQFAGTYGGLAQDVFVTLAGWQVVTGQPLRNLQVAGRMAPGVTRRQAATEVHALAARYATSDPSNRGWDAVVLAPSESPRGFSGGLAPIVGILLVVVALVLAIACANLASLLLARAVDRQRETAIRLSLGAERSDLLRLQVVESLLLAVGGSLLGLVPASLLAVALFSALPLGNLSIHLDLALDAPVLAATLIVALLAALLSSAAPTLFARHVSPALTLRSESAGAIGGRRKNRLRTGLVAMQLALSLAAIAGAAVLVRATARSLAADPGFQRHGGLVATVSLGALGYDEARGQQFVAAALERLSVLPGVESASISSFVPMGVAGGGNGRRFELDGYTPPDGETLGAVTDNVGPGYLSTLGARLVAGREFTATDRSGTQPVAMVTEEFARRYLPDGAIGHRLRIGGEWREIVGVAADATYSEVGEAKLPRIYLPVLQVFHGRLTFLVRAAGDPTALARPLAAVVASLDPDLPVTDIESLQQHTAAGAFAPRIASLMLTGLGSLALALAAVGLFGLLAFSVAARRRELGVRAALGASGNDLVSLVMRDAGRLVAIGGGIGLLVAGALGKLISGVFAGAEPFDPVAFALAFLVLAVTAALASAAPALRASRIAPASVLREE